MMIAFFGTGGWGIALGLYMGSLPYQTSDETNFFLIVLLGVINLCVGGVCGFILLTQEPKHKKLKKKKD